MNHWKISGTQAFSALSLFLQYNVACLLKPPWTWSYESGECCAWMTFRNEATDAETSFHQTELNVDVNCQNTADKNMLSHRYHTGIIQIFYRFLTDFIQMISTYKNFMSVPRPEICLCCCLGHFCESPPLIISLRSGRTADDSVAPRFCSKWSGLNSHFWYFTEFYF